MALSAGARRRLPAEHRVVLARIDLLRDLHPVARGWHSAQR